MPALLGLGRWVLAVLLVVLAPQVRGDVFLRDDGISVALTNVPVDDDFVRVVIETVAAPVPETLSANPSGPAAVPGGNLPPLSDRVAERGPYSALIAAAAKRHRVSVALLHALVQVESNFNPRAVSPKGALGLTQLMPATARRLGVGDAFDPAANLDAGARYLRELLTEFKEDHHLALAAYNAGPGAVRRHGGIPRYAETQQYVPRVLEVAARAGLQRGPRGR